MTEPRRGFMIDGGMTKRLLDYFEANPDEELMYEDVAIKFGVKSQAVRDAVGRLRKRGVLESVRVIRPVAKGRAQVTPAEALQRMADEAAELGLGY